VTDALRSLVADGKTTEFQEFVDGIITGKAQKTLLLIWNGLECRWRGIHGIVIVRGRCDCSDVELLQMSRR
jgi:hypothetical protein